MSLNAHQRIEQLKTLCCFADINIEHLSANDKQRFQSEGNHRRACPYCLMYCWWFFEQGVLPGLVLPDLILLWVYSGSLLASVFLTFSVADLRLARGRSPLWAKISIFSGSFGESWSNMLSPPSGKSWILG